MLEAVGLGHRVDHYAASALRRAEAARRDRAGARRTARASCSPTSRPPALDKQSGREVVDLLHQLAKEQGCAILLVTHDNRILDIADRLITLEDGRLASFVSGVTLQAGNMMSALGQLYRQGELVRHVAGLPDTEFAQVLEGVTSEFDQLLRTLSLANQEAIDGLVAQVLEAVTVKIRERLQAERATIFLVDEAHGLLRSKIAHHPGDRPLSIEVPSSQGIAGHVARTGEPVNAADAYDDPRFDPTTDRRTGFRTRGVLAVPLRDHDQRVFAVAQLLNKRGGPSFTAADERALTDFARPLAVILETCRALDTRGAAVTASPAG